MFACLFLPSAAAAEPGGVPDALEAVARAFSPRVEVHAAEMVTLDVDGLQRLLGGPDVIGRELLRDARDRGCDANVALAATRTAARLLAVARPGLTLIPPGAERRELSRLPLSLLARLVEHDRSQAKEGVPAGLFRRWGLKTLGDLAALPAPALSERIGQDGPRWQRLARGEDLEPLVARPPEPPIEETLDLEWPVEGLEPLSFLLPRVLEPICERLARADQAAVSIEITFRLATREQVARSLQLPAPMRDAKVLRTLILLHLESHPLGGGVERLTVHVEPAPARILQFSLLARARPFPEQMATLLARLSALMGERRVGSPALVDSYRPGAFAMEPFAVAEPASRRGNLPARQEARATPGKVGGKPAGLPGPAVVVRRLALPVPARVLVQAGRPVRVATERHGLEGGRVETAAGPWRTSGEWWRVGSSPERGGVAAASNGACPERGRTAAVSNGACPERGRPAAESNGACTEHGRTAAASNGACPERGRPAAESNGARPERGRAAAESNGACPERGRPAAESNGWSRDEWDVALSDGAVYRIYRDRAGDRWFVDGIVD